MKSLSKGLTKPVATIYMLENKAPDWLSGPSNIYDPFGEFGVCFCAIFFRPDLGCFDVNKDQFFGYLNYSSIFEIFRIYTLFTSFMSSNISKTASTLLSVSPFDPPSLLPDKFCNTI